MTRPWWAVIAPYAATGGAVAYGALRTYWALGHRPYFPPMGYDLVVTSGWGAVGLCAAAAVLAPLVAAVPRGRYAPAARAAAVAVATGLVISSAFIVPDLVALLFPGIGVPSPAAPASRAACLALGIAVALTALASRRTSRKSCPYCGRPPESAHAHDASTDAARTHGASVHEAGVDGASALDPRAQDASRSARLHAPGAARAHAPRTDGPRSYVDRPHATRQANLEPGHAARVAPGWAVIAAYVAVAGCLVRFGAQAAIGFGADSVPIGEDSRVAWVAFAGCMLLAGTLLPLALVYRWGRVFPRWTLFLAGRRVPRTLLAVPACFVSGGLLVYFGTGLGQLVIAAMTGQALTSPEIPGGFLWTAVLAYVMWGAGLAVATVAYLRRTRPACAHCGHGGAVDTASATVRAALL